MPRFNLNWLYIAIIAGLGVLFFQGNMGDGTGYKSEVEYSTFRAYVDSGYAKSITIDKTEGLVSMEVKPENIRTVFKTGTDQVGKRPAVYAKGPSIDRVSDDLEKAAYKGPVKYIESTNYFLS